MHDTTTTVILVVVLLAAAGVLESYAGHKDINTTHFGSRPDIIRLILGVCRT